MPETFYTHAVWRVLPGREEEFIEAWKGLGDVFRHLDNPSRHGILIQSVNDPTLFYSFGPWDTLEQIQAMRADPASQYAIRRLVELCAEATPGTFRMAGEIHL